MASVLSCFVRVVSRLAFSKFLTKTDELHFLGHVIGKDGVAVDPAKIAAIEKWPLPKSLKEFQSILGPLKLLQKFCGSFQFCGCAPYGLDRRDWKRTSTQTNSGNRLEQPE